MLQKGRIYEHSLMPGVFIRVDNIHKRDRTYIYLSVSWFRKDDITKKLVDMDTPQDMVIMSDEEKYYREVSK